MPETEGSKPSKKKFKAYPIGYFHIDIAELQTAEGKLYLYVAIDRTSKFAFVQLARKTGRTSAAAFLEALIAAVPYKIHTVLTDNGIQFTFPPRYADGPTARYATHMFDMRCQENGIEHRLTKIKHPWTNGQVERMNRTIKEATVQRYHYDRHDQLEAHLADFINAYNYARRLKTLKGLTPYEYICKCWTSQPERFKFNPLQQMPGLNILNPGCIECGRATGTMRFGSHGLCAVRSVTTALARSRPDIAHLYQVNVLATPYMTRMPAAPTITCSQMPASSSVRSA